MIYEIIILEFEKGVLLKMEIELEKVKEELKEILSEKRYTHSLGTMKKAEELAVIYGEDKEKAAFAGLIHDIAKEMSKDEILEYVEKHNIEMDEVESRNLGLMHAKLGASIAKEKYNADEEIQKAILYHTTGNIKMDRFAKIIYLADKLEENRDYPGVEELRKIAQTDLDEAILITIDFVLEKSIKLKRLIHPNAIEVRNYIIG